MENNVQQIPNAVSDAADFLNGLGGGDGEGDQLLNELGFKETPAAQQPFANGNVEVIKPEDLNAKKKVEAPARPAEAKKPAATVDENDSELLDVRQEAGKDSFKTLDEWNAVLKKEFGIEDPAKAREAIKEWRKQAQNAAQATQQYKNLAGYVAKMPKHLYDVFNAWGKGGDEYAQAVQRFNNSIDYSLPFEKQNIKFVAKEISPSINTTDKNRSDYVDLEDANDPYTKVILDNIQATYNERAKQVKSERGKIEKAQEQRALTVSKSIDTSVEKLTASFPRISPERINAVKEALASNDLESLLFQNEESQYTDQAALRTYMALYGPEEIEKLKAKVKKQQDQLDELLHKGGEQINSGNRGGSTEAIPQEFKAIEDYLPGKRSNQLNYEVVKN